MARFRVLPTIVFVAILAILPEARALLATGLGGGVVLGGLLILARHHIGGGGPRRGTPVALFPRPVRVAISHGAPGL
jgi:hypothetical protein